jgi:hypothetical protein
MSAALATHAALIEFRLSPAGSDTAVGLSPLNESPPILNSFGGGGAQPGTILFDTDTAQLSFEFAYGMVGGFPNLTGPATAFHIHGPAPTGQNAGVLFDLSPFYLPLVPPMFGGLVHGAVVYPPDQIAGLFAGSNYINIHTALNPGGEIRGQLIPLLPPAPSTPANTPPSVQCAGDATVECGPASVSANVGDAEGDALIVVWSVNGIPVQTNQVSGGVAPTAATVVLTMTFSVGANEVSVTATDTQGLPASCSTVVSVVDHTPPVLSGVAAEPNTLWPPNHKMVPVTISAEVADGCSAAAWQIVSVTCNEPTNGKGDGNTAGDWLISSSNTVLLRAERSGKGSGRVYTIWVRGVDAAGNLSSPQSVMVPVTQPSSNRRKP